jgi:uncharacterized protein (DUF2141 family)
MVERLVKFTRAALLVAISAPLGAASPGELGTLRVGVAGVEPRPGKLLVRLYDSSDHWLEPSGAIRTIVIDPAQSRGVAFEQLPRGTYAVAIVHDENGDEKMNIAFLPVPHVLEGGGVSNDARSKWGPPRYDDAAFEFRPPDQSITVTLRY